MRALVAATVLLVTLHAAPAHSQDWPLLGRSTLRNPAVEAANPPRDWDVGRFDRNSNAWDATTARNIKWCVPLGSQTYGAPVVAGGKVFVGTNNAHGYLRRYPPDHDLGCLIAFREADGQFLWQYSAEKLPTGRVHDWPLQGIASSPAVEGDRMWFVDNRCRLVCLDTQGYQDGEDDGPIRQEEVTLLRLLPGIPPTASPLLRYPSTHWALHQLLVQHGVNARSRSFQASGPSSWKGSASRNDAHAIEIQTRGRALVVTHPDDRRSIETVIARPELVALDQGKLPRAVAGELEKLNIRPAPALNWQAAPDGQNWSFTADFGDDLPPQRIKLHFNGLWLSVSRQLTLRDTREADVVWRLDMMRELDVSPHNLSTSPPAVWGDLLFLCTSNGLDESHVNLPKPDAPSFIAVEKSTGRVVWQDSSPGKNILHGQWSGACIGELGGVPQVIFPGGDGWVYSFHAEDWDRDQAKPKLLWKFDANPKTSQWKLGGSGTRNNVVAPPVIYQQRVYVVVGQDPEHGEGQGHLYCLDPTKRGDVSAELAMRREGSALRPLAPRRVQAVDPAADEVAIPNPNSAVIWHYQSADRNGDGTVEFEEEMHRAIASPAIKDGLLVITDYTGLVHCLDAKSGKAHWTCDLLAASWASALIAGDWIYQGDEDGEMAIFPLAADPRGFLESRTERSADGSEFRYVAPKVEIDMANSLYSSPAYANGTLFVANRTHLFAIETGAQRVPDDSDGR